MKIHRSIFAIAIAVIMLCIAFNPPIASAEVYPARSTKVLVLCDESYRAYLKSSYGEYNSDIVAQIMKLAARPFSNVWNNGLDITIMSYEDVIGAPNSVLAGENGCNNLWHWEYYKSGEDRYRKWNHYGSCNCNHNLYCDGPVTGYHHTSQAPILNATEAYLQSDLVPYDVVATIVGHNLCYTTGNVYSGYTHSYCGGMTRPASKVLCVSGILNYTGWENSTDVSGQRMISTVHTFQHELSHVFGCPDGGCTANEACIMSGAFDGVISVNNLWCNSCRVRFANNIGIFDGNN